MTPNYVIDASAALALLNSEHAQLDLQSILPGNPIASVNYSEVADFFARLGHPRDRIAGALDMLDFDIHVVDAELALDAAMLRPIDPSSSLADRCCVALAKRLDLPVLTGDRPMEKVAAAAGVVLTFIR